MYNRGPLDLLLFQIFITLKNPSSSAGSEPTNLGSNGKHVTTRPLRQTVLLHINNTTIIMACYIRNIMRKRNNTIDTDKNAKALNGLARNTVNTEEYPTKKIFTK
jgi:hypothetical protein